MKITKYFLIFLIFLNSCGSMKEAGQVLRNEKIKTTDEFLVKKKQPLVLPPDFEKIPEPGSIKDQNIDEKDQIKKILKVPKEGKSSINKSKSVEKSIIEKIRK